MSKKSQDTLNIHLAKGVLYQLADTFGVAADPDDIESMREAVKTVGQELPPSMAQELSSLVEDLFTPPAKTRTADEDKQLMERALNLAEQNDLWHAKVLGEDLQDMNAKMAEVDFAPPFKKTLH